jgi:hypothetical protein
LSSFFGDGGIAEKQSSPIEIVSTLTGLTALGVGQKSSVNLQKKIDNPDKVYASDILLTSIFFSDFWSGLYDCLSNLVRRITFFSPEELRHWPEPATGLWASGGKRSDNLKHSKPIAVH